MTKVKGLLGEGIGEMFDPSFLAHPLGYCQGTPHEQMLCKGYNWWSGIGSVFTPKDLAAVFIVVTWWRKHNCHVKGCPRLQWHPHPDHGHPVCKKHHPDSSDLT